LTRPLQPSEEISAWLEGGSSRNVGVSRFPVIWCRSRQQRLRHTYAFRRGSVEYCGEKIPSVSISLLVVRLMSRVEVRAAGRPISFWSRAKVGLLWD
jgi:hypothetical protein